jgi:hypothetical protein
MRYEVYQFISIVHQQMIAIKTERKTVNANGFFATCFSPAFRRAYWEYMTSGWNWFDMLSIAAVGTSICLQVDAMIRYSPWNSFKERQSTDHESLFFQYAVVTGISFPLVSVNMLFYMQANKTSGKLVRMIFKICSGSFSLVLILGLITFGFAASFSVLFGNFNKNEVKVPFGSYGRSLLAVFGFIFANFDVSDVDNAISPNLATLLIVVFVTFVSIILLNLLIAIIVSRISYHLSIACDLIFNHNYRVINMMKFKKMQTWSGYVVRQSL